MSVSIYPVLISKIAASLNAVKDDGKLKAVFAYPKNDLEEYPSAIFFPSGLSNEYNNTGANFKIYNFTIDIVVGVIQEGLEDIYSTVMPNVLDAVIEQLDNDWNAGTIDGSQAWTNIDTGQWILSQEQSGLELTAELILQIKVLTNNN